ncbi:glycosyltransferase family 4 protein [Paeniglutamicibacter psychrophenolicus]|uniref:glycosyltransferase family 4 protein n=1 Tax=Paeniglutamicibacter psychrophenolicus TaxID=257454 RepID=UPI00278699A5|nr:glycosyltransferase family 4 protein [Paeniglutamicibacter psychrophenolicus]MDQ0095951.1 glycosyltransferase involved in cell wall biosynthesis [Paeniglutamicibacter psychrophenolicus]
MTELTPVRLGSRVLRVFQNLRTISRIVIENLLDDPTYFLLQVSRRIDSGSLARIAGSCQRVLPPRAVLLRSFILMLSGNTSQLGKYLRTVDTEPLSDQKLARLGDMAVAIQDSISTSYLLDGRDSENPALRRTKARHAWYMGNMQEAIDLLATLVPPSNRQLRHYRSELEVFKGVLPEIGRREVPQSGEIAAPTTALHFLTNSLPHTGSGYAQRSHSIMTSLRDEKWHVEVLTRAGYPLSTGKFLAKAMDHIDGITYRRVLPRTYSSDTRSKIQQQADALVDAVVRLKPTVLHTTTDFTNAIAVMCVAESFGLPWVYEVRGQLADTWAATRPADAKSSQRYRLFKEREAFVASRATHVVTLGESMRSELIARGVEDDKISIAPNAIGDAYLDEPIERNEARSLLGLSKSHQYVGTVSSLVAYEGLDLLVRAVAELIPENRALRLLIVGSGVEANNLRELSIELGIDEFCIFPGRVPREDARTYHCALDIFVVPRRNLSVTQAVTPLKPVEALACEVPVIAADLPALRELVEQDVTGLLVKPDDVGQLAESIRTLLADPSKRASMGAAGRKAMLADRTWAANAQKLSATYKLIADKLQ